MQGLTSAFFFCFSLERGGGLPVGHDALGLLGVDGRVRGRRALPPALALALGRAARAPLRHRLCTGMTWSIAESILWYSMHAPLVI